MRYFISPQIMIAHDGDFLLLADERDALRIRSSAEIAACVRAMTSGVDEATMRAFLEHRETRALIETLNASNWIIAVDADEFSGTIHERQYGHLAALTGRPDRAQRALVSARVAILGLGGIGACVLQHLIGAGVAAFALIDDDTVARHNLNRQYIYDDASAGMAKVDAAAMYVRARVPDAELWLRRMRVHAADDLDALAEFRPDILVLAADHPVGRIHAIAGAAAWQLGVPMIGAGLGLRAGHWGPLLVPGVTACAACFERELCAALSQSEQSVVDAMQQVTPYSFGPSNSAIAAFLAADVLHHLATGAAVPSLGTRLIHDFATMRTTRFGAPPCSCPFAPSLAVPESAPSESAPSESIEEGRP